MARLTDLVEVMELKTTRPAWILCGLGMLGSACYAARAGADEAAPEREEVVTRAAEPASRFRLGLETTVLSAGSGKMEITQGMVKEEVEYKLTRSGFSNPALNLGGELAEREGTWDPSVTPEDESATDEAGADEAGPADEPENAPAGDEAAEEDAAPPGGAAAPSKSKPENVPPWLRGAGGE